MHFEDIYQLVKYIPRGKVLTYKKIAQILGVKDIRLVGYALHANKNPDLIPCHRVVRQDGSIAAGYAYGGREQQEKKLKAERVIFSDNQTVDLRRSLWQIPKELLSDYRRKGISVKYTNLKFSEHH